MSSLAAERNRKILQELVSQPGNDVCADCKAPAPRWASHNLGIFLCITCASLHRRLGTHISKVKSITMDTFTREQVETMRQIGNVKSNSIYNPNELKHPPPTNLMDGERDSELEKYVRGKYEFKQFVAKVTPKPDGSSRALSVPPSQSSSAFRSVGTTNTNAPRAPPARSASQPVHTQPSLQPQPSSQPLQHPRVPQPPSQPVQSAPKDGVWADLISLQTSSSPSLPLQYQAPQQQLQQQPVFSNQTFAMNASPSPTMLLSLNPNLYQPQLMIPPSSSFTPAFPSAGMLPPSPLTQATLQSQFPMVQAPVAQPLHQNGFIGLQQQQQPSFGQMNGQFVMPPSPQPILTGPLQQGQGFLTPSPQPQVFNPQFTQQGGWPPPGSPMQGWGSGPM